VYFPASLSPREFVIIAKIKGIIKQGYMESYEYFEIISSLMLKLR
jgi:hypothetical protein